MDFWDMCIRLSNNLDFPSKRVLLNTLDRHHASLEMIEDRSTELQMNSAMMIKYREDMRYVLIKNITFDVLISFYDVNSQSALLIRPSADLDKNSIEQINRRLSNLKKPNIEARIVGMQNNDDSMADVVKAMYMLKKGRLIEVDIFGSNVRNIAMDLKTGALYDLLLLNRIYRPTELANTVTKQQFSEKISKLGFVNQ
jgi:hypothetical protein